MITSIATGCKVLKYTNIYVTFKNVFKSFYFEYFYSFVPIAIRWLDFFICPKFVIR